VLFTINCFLLVLIIMIQQGKSSMGIGNLGGSAQMLFGGSGGQDILQKITSVLGLIYLFGSLGLVMLGARHNPLPYIRKNKIAVTKTVPMTEQRSVDMQESAPELPTETSPADAA
jgi:protein translocase SecG subunit